jgi:hypothetical protein
MIPSNRTLEVGAEQVEEESRLAEMSEQCPVAEDPFAASIPSVEIL